MKRLHGHELIHLIVRQERSMTLEEIKETAETVFGDDVNYYTCSESSMNTDELIQFLLVRQKLVKNGLGYVINLGEVCDHDH